MANITINGATFTGTAQECAQFMAFMSACTASMGASVSAPATAYVSAPTPAQAPTQAPTPAPTPVAPTVYEHVSESVTVRFVHEARKIGGKTVHVVSYTLPDGKYVYQRDVRKCANAHLSAQGATLLEEAYTDAKGNAKTRNVYTLAKKQADALNGTELTVTAEMRNGERDKWTAKAERKAKKGARA